MAPYDMQTTNDAVDSLPFVVQPRTFIDHSAGLIHSLAFGQMEDNPLVTLEDIRDRVKAVEIRQDPLDFIWDMKTIMVGFENNRPTLVHICGERVGERMPFTKAGWEQFCEMVLMNVGQRKSIEFQAQSGRGIGVKDQYGKIHESKYGGNHYAAFQMNWFISNYAEDRQIRLRTIRTRIGDRIERVVRCVATPSYCPFDELEFINLILDSERRLSDRPVVRYKQGDSGMSLRIIDEEDLTNWMNSELNVPIKTRDFYNSPIKKSRVVSSYGAYRLICKNGMKSHDKKSSIKLYHRGDSDEIRRAIRNHSEETIAIRDGLIHQYRQAMEIAIDDPFQWMESAMLGFRQSATSIDKVRQGMKDETSSEIGLLSGVVDGITLIAQDFDIFDQVEMEEVASKVLAKGIQQADSKGMIRVEVSNA